MNTPRERHQHGCGGGWLEADQFAFVNRPLHVSIQRADSLTAGRRRYRDLMLLAYARTALGRHALWLRERFGG